MKKNLEKFFAREYGADVVRLENVFNGLNKPFEMAYFQVNIGEATYEHNHAEREIFLCLEGHGECNLQDQMFPIEPNDLWFVERGQNHKIINNGNEVLKMISIWWH
jgi:mannose-6-phosphate isomerase-like protein (cupin superfamily)